MSFHYISVSFSIGSHVGAVLGVCWAFFAHLIFDILNLVIIGSVITNGLIFHAVMYAGQPIIRFEMFPTRMRYSGSRTSTRSPDPGGTPRSNLPDDPSLELPVVATGSKLHPDRLIA